jgi:hypothetical protein
MLSEPDMFWHLETGRRLVETHHFPTTDAYSWTRNGAYWITMEWISQVLFTLALKAGGWVGVVALASAAVAGALAMIFAELSRRMELVWSLCLTLAVAAVADQFVVVRPHVLAWPVFVGWLIIMLRAAEAGRTPPLWSLALMAFWVNLHGSYLIGLALIPFFALEAVLRLAPEQRAGLALRWTLMGAALATLAVLAHPNGLGALAYTFSVLEIGSSLHLINEWKQLDFSSISPFELFVLGGGAFALVAGVKVPWPRVVMLTILLHFAFLHLRHQPLFALAAALTLAGPIGERLGAANNGRWSRMLEFAPMAGAILALVSTVAATQSPIFRPVPHATPTKAIAAARAAGYVGHVFNNYYFGGFLISQGVPTFIDGRTELFGAKHLEDYYAARDATDAEALQRYFGQNDVAWTLLQPNDAAVAVLDKLDGWTRLYADEFAVVHVRRPAGG